MSKKNHKEHCFPWSVWYIVASSMLNYVVHVAVGQFLRASPLIPLVLNGILYTMPQDLKDYMRQAGEVTFADAHKQRRNEGIVEFASYKDLKNVLDKLDGTELNGRKIKLVEDRANTKRSRTPSHSRSRTRSRSRSRSNRRSRSRSEGKDGSKSPETKNKRDSRKSRSSSESSKSRSRSVSRANGDDN